MTAAAQPTSEFAAAHGSPSLITAARELQAVPGAERSGGSESFLKIVLAQAAYAWQK